MLCRAGPISVPPVIACSRCQSSQIQEESPGVGLGVCHLPLGTALALSLTPALTPAPETSLASSTCLTPWPEPPALTPWTLKRAGTTTNYD
ncbi:unnamed protein product [Boreogadus saida]